LFDFACKYSRRDDKAALYRELLTFDMYLRENLKSRPGFLPQSAIDKETLRSLRAGRELYISHIEKFDYPVWLEEAYLCGVKLSAPKYVIFDYKERNALTHDAMVVITD
jgi:hypothetical protein